MSRRTIGSLLVRLGMDTKEADKAIKNFDRNLKNAAKNMESIGTKMSVAFTVPLVALAKESIQAFDRQAQAEKKLEVAIGGVNKALLAQAAAIQKRTTFGDEAIIEQQAFLASLGLNEKQIMDTTDAAVNLSAALGISLESATKNLAKTTAGMTGELGELIPALKNFTPEQLKAGAAIEYANTQFAGFAESAAKTGTGPLKQLQNQLGDLGEELGKVLLPVVTKLVEWVKKMADAFSGLSEGTKQTIVVLGALVAASGPLMVYLSAIPRLIRGTLDFADALRKLATMKVAGGSALSMLSSGGLPALLAAGGSAAIGGALGENSGLFAGMQSVSGEEMGFMDKAWAGIKLSTGLSQGAGGLAGKAGSMFMGEVTKKQRETFNNAGQAVTDSIESAKMLAQNAAKVAAQALIDAKKKPTGPKGPKAAKSDSIELNMWADAFSPAFSQYAGEDWSVKALPMLQGGITGGGGGLSAQGMGSILPDMSENLKTNMGFWRDWSTTVVDAIGMMGNALAEGENFFLAFGKTALAVANQVIQAAIGKIIAQIVAGESSKGLVGSLLGLAGAGVVVGLMTSLISKSKAPKLAQGGLAYGPTMAMVGDNPNANIDPEVISPLSKLKSMIQGAGQQTVQVVGVIRGDDILLQTSRANNYAIRRGAGNAISF